MCRFMVRGHPPLTWCLTWCSALTQEQVYKGKNEILLSELILDPAHSILTQSFDSRLRLVGLPSNRYAHSSQ
jgi:hypothetical protein